MLAALADGAKRSMRQSSHVLPPLAGEPAADGFGDPVVGCAVPADREAYEARPGRGGAGVGRRHRRGLAGAAGRRRATGRLIVVEIVPEMADHLRGVLPGVQVLEGDARDLPGLLPHHWHGRIGSVVCGIPLLLLPLAEQRRFIARDRGGRAGPRLPALQLLRHLAAALAQACPDRAARGLDAAQLPARQRVALRFPARWTVAIAGR